MEKTTNLFNQNKFSFAEGGNRSENKEKISSYENLISRISSSSSINDILNTFQDNQQIVKNEHIVLCLRMMARLLRTTN